MRHPMMSSKHASISLVLTFCLGIAASACGSDASDDSSANQGGSSGSAAGGTAHAGSSAAGGSSGGNHAGAAGNAGAVGVAGATGISGSGGAASGSAGSSASSGTGGMLAGTGGSGAAGTGGTSSAAGATGSAGSTGNGSAPAGTVLACIGAGCPNGACGGESDTDCGTAYPAPVGAGSALCAAGATAQYCLLLQSPPTYEVTCKAGVATYAACDISCGYDNDAMTATCH